MSAPTIVLAQVFAQGPPDPFPPNQPLVPPSPGTQVNECSISTANQTPNARKEGSPSPLLLLTAQP
jgi:hypothetical protein